MKDIEKKITLIKKTRCEFICTVKTKNNSSNDR